MRIVQVIPGAGDFYCENCLRDTVLLRALRQQGHDVLAVPLYLPIVRGPAEEDCRGAVFFGALNVYLQQTWRLFRWTPRWLDRLLDSPAILGLVARQVRMTNPLALGKTTLSMLRGPDGRQAKELDRLAGYLSGLGRIDAVLLSDALLAGLAGPLRQRLRAPVVCMLQDEDEWLDYLSEPYRAQCWAELASRCADIDAFVAVSRYYADLMAGRLKVPADRISVIHSALDLHGYEAAPTPPAAPTIGFLSRLCRHKGLELLVDAMEILRGRFPNVRLRAAGGCIADDRPFLRQLRRRLNKCGLASQVELLPNLTRSARQEFLRSLSVMCVPGLRAEAFGRYIIEALACGVPVVAVDHGAAGEILGATGGGLLVAPNDPAALAGGLGAVLGDKFAAGELGLAGCQVVRERFSDAHMARAMASLLGALSDKVKTKAKTNA